MIAAFLPLAVIALLGAALRCLAAGLLVFHFPPIPGPTKGAMMPGSAFGNVSYLGLPVLLGMALRFRPTRLMGLALPVAVIKLVASPLIVFAAIGPIGLTGVDGTAAVPEAAMPSQLLSFIIAGKFKLDEETPAVVIMVDTVLAFLPLSLLRSLLTV